MEYLVVKLAQAGLQVQSSGVCELSKHLEVGDELSVGRRRDTENEIQQHLLFICISDAFTERDTKTT